jgi:hypothetical protein
MIVDPGMDPFHDAIGKLIHRSLGLEIMLGVAVDYLTDASASDAASKGPSWCVNELRAFAERIAEPDRSDLLDAMDIATAVLQLRNAVVHGYSVPSADGSRKQSQRTVRRRGRYEQVRVDYTRESLLEACERLRIPFGILQSRMGRWADALGIEIDKD